MFGCGHRYLTNIDCLSFVMCPLLAPHLPRRFSAFFSFLFLLCLLTVLIRQTRQAVHAINQSIFLRCLWLWYMWRHYFAVTTTHSPISCNLGCQCQPQFSLSFLDVCGFNQKQQQMKLRQYKCCLNWVTRLGDFSPTGLLWEAHYDFKKR